jgi:hypothetical protein
MLQVRAQRVGMSRIVQEASDPGDNLLVFGIEHVLQPVQRL